MKSCWLASDDTAARKGDGMIYITSPRERRDRVFPRYNCCITPPRRARTEGPPARPAASERHVALLCNGHAHGRPFDPPPPLDGRPRCSRRVPSSRRHTQTHAAALSRGARTPLYTDDVFRGRECRTPYITKISPLRRVYVSVFDPPSRRRTLAKIASFRPSVRSVTRDFYVIFW